MRSNFQKLSLLAPPHVFMSALDPRNTVILSIGDGHHRNMKSHAAGVSVQNWEEILPGTWMVGFNNPGVNTSGILVLYVVIFLHM